MIEKTNKSAIWRFEGRAWWSSGYDSTLPQQGHGFDPWFGNKILHATQHGQKINK